MSTSRGGGALKTCQICHDAKIRCIKTQDSPSCDRCMRLGKTCIFNPSRRNLVRRGRSRSRTSRLEEPRGREDVARLSPLSNPPRTGSSHDPFLRGLLSLESGQELLDYFAAKMTLHFPFVILPLGVSASDLIRDRPCVCLAALAAAAHKQVALQRSLGRLFNELVSSRLVAGPFHSLDLLQGLLIHVAWAHYQPRPRRHTQLLYLANSIICDMRLDRPRKPKVWNVDGVKDLSTTTSDHELRHEKRAVAGAYYLSSSSSILLEKSQHFTFSPHISQTCEDLAQEGEGYALTDNHIRYIVQLQRLVEEVSSAAGRGSSGTLFAPSREDAAATTLQRIKQTGNNIKSTLPFPLSDSPLVSLQLSLLELLLSQSTPGGGLFGLDRFHDVGSAEARAAPENHATLVEWLSVSISAARSLFGMILVLPPGEEGAVSNIGWITMQCALSLAVRLDLDAAYGSASEFTRHLSHFLDMPHTLRQIVMRLESAASSDVDETGDRDTFYYLAQRARRLESWYLEQHGRAKARAVRGAGDEIGRSFLSGTQDLDLRDMGLGQGTAMNPISSTTSVDSEAWTSSIGWDGDDAHAASMGEYLFSDLLQLPTDIGFTQP